MGNGRGGTHGIEGVGAASAELARVRAQGTFAFKGRIQIQYLTVASVTRDVPEGCSAVDISHRFELGKKRSFNAHWHHFVVCDDAKRHMVPRLSHTSSFRSTAQPCR